MTFQEYEIYQKELLDKVVEMGSTKGREYANGDDRFGNFNRLSERLGTTNLAIAWVYTTKHIDSLESYIRNKREFSTEKIESRIVDIITYLTLIAGMIKDSERFDNHELHLESYTKVLKDLTNRQEFKVKEQEERRNAKPVQCKYCKENATVYNLHTLEVTCEKHKTKEVSGL